MKEADHTKDNGRACLSQEILVVIVVLKTICLKSVFKTACLNYIYLV